VELSLVRVLSFVSLSLYSVWSEFLQCNIVSRLALDSFFANHIYTSSSTTQFAYFVYISWTHLSVILVVRTKKCIIIFSVTFMHLSAWHTVRMIHMYV
jgi:hypothetical protein